MGVLDKVVAVTDVPLVVDLDGTLIKTDMLTEGMLRSLLLRPLTLLSVPRWLAAGKATLKLKLAEEGGVDVNSLPYNEDMLEYCKEERNRGRRIYLATAANRVLAEAVAEKVGFFDAVFASDDRTNLAGSEKAKRLCAEFGERGFDYAGDAAADLPVWERANGIIGVNCAARFAHQIQETYPNAQFIGNRAGRLRMLVRAMRVHQWAKNVLLFVPAIAAHSVEAESIAASILGFLAFSLVASSVYLVNDLVDLNSDRVHPTKRHRPFASGDLPLISAAWLVPLLLATGFGLASLLSWQFVGVLAGYLGLTFAYSLWLKRKMLVDMLVLGGLYTLRIVAGVASRFAARGHGTIVGISSVAGDRGRAANYVYGAAKAGFTAYLSGLRNRFGHSAIRVVTVKPGFVATRMTAGMKTPALLTAQPDEVAAAVLKAVNSGSDVVYVRPLWRWIMTAISLIPEPLFKRMHV